MEFEPSNYELALAAIESGDLDEAYEPLSRALKSCVDDPDELLQIAGLYNYLDEFSTALPPIKRALRLRPGYPMALSQLGTALNGLRKSRLAGRAFKEFLLSIDASYALRGLATANRRVGSHDQAVALYAASISIDPDDLSAYNNMAISLNKLGRHKEAIKACKAGLRLDPKDRDLRLNLIASHREANNNAVALRLVNEFIQEYPACFEALLELGNVLANYKRYEEAIDAFKRAKDSNSLSPSAYINLGITYDETDELKMGESEYRAALEIASFDADIHHNLGVNLKLQNRLDEAIVEFDIEERIKASEARKARRV